MCSTSYMNSIALVSLYYNPVFHFCLLTYLNSTSSVRREAGADLTLKFHRLELKKASEDVRDKEEARLNETLKSNKLKIKGPQTDGRSRSGLESKGVEPGI